jgi:hypothetical protein
MKQQPQVAFTSQSDFSKLKVAGPAAQDNTNIELAIYDLMVDGVSRTVNQIVRTLAVLGYEASQINNRMVGLLFKKEWFVEGTLSGKPSYKLKKSAKRTIALTTAAKGLESVKASDIVVRSSAEQPFSSASKTPQTVEVTYKRNRSLIAKENTMPQEPTPQPADKPVQHIVLPDDPVKTALWKVMSDHAWYKRGDLEVLLSHIKLRTINMSLEQMEVDNLIEVDRSNVKEGFLFRLPEGVPMPEGGRPYKQRTFKSKATPPQPELPLENQTMQSDIPEGYERPDNTPTVGERLKNHDEKIIDGVRANVADAAQSVDGNQLAKDFEQQVQHNSDIAAEPSAMQVLGDALGSALQPRRLSAEIRAKAAEISAQFPDDSVDQPKEKSPLIMETGATRASPTEEVPLISIGGVTIKGVVFSYKEARELLKELRLYGFGSESYYQAAPVTSYVKMERRFSVSGVDFTEFEMNSLASYLASELE